MHRFQFPQCTVIGPTHPISYSHLMSGAVPEKCTTCEHLFEGSCLRAVQSTGHLQLDYAPCRKRGSTRPIRIVNEYFSANVDVPEKCSSCPLLQVDARRGFSCGEDAEIWRSFPRNIDWGAWNPSRPDTVFNNACNTRSFVDFLSQGEHVKAIQAFRAYNPDASISDARAAVAATERALAVPAST